MDLHSTHPGIEDLARSARKRVPHFVWEYLDSATGSEHGRAMAEAELDALRLIPHVLRGIEEAELKTTLMGRAYPLPFGFAPVGMAGVIRAGGEAMLAEVAAAEGVPYTLSTVAAATPEEVGRKAGDQGWFQLYTPRDPEIRRDLCRRAKEAGFHTLVMTADVPVASRRERLVRSGLQNPMKITPRIALDVARRPAWALDVLRSGKPRLKTLEPYADPDSATGSTGHIGYKLRTAPDLDYLKALRDEWEGPLVVKGVLSATDAVAVRAAGADAIWVSNHTGRQFDGGPAPIHQLPRVRAAVGPDVPVIYDSGIRSGLDILRALAMGADFCMLGRAAQYGVAAFGTRGARHVVEVMRAQMRADMANIGCARLSDLHEHLAMDAP